jgi:hypothetical protein
MTKKRVLQYMYSGTINAERRERIGTKRKHLK